jgi:hypothetical protein
MLHWSTHEIKEVRKKKGVSLASAIQKVFGLLVPIEKFHKGTLSGPSLATNPVKVIVRR